MSKKNTAAEDVQLTSGTASIVGLPQPPAEPVAAANAARASGERLLTLCRKVRKELPASKIVLTFDDHPGAPFTAQALPTAEQCKVMAFDAFDADIAKPMATLAQEFADKPFKEASATSAEAAVKALLG